MSDLNPIEYFFAHTDSVGATLFCILLLMSLVSWFWIVGKSLLLWQLKRRSTRYRLNMWKSDPTGSGPAEESNNPFSRLAQASFSVHADVREIQATDREELLLRCMNRVVGEEGTRLENGQTLLASIAAVSPFVGLFGTVWGVHHALSAISIEGAASLAQIAGPVGEALIMTALGLAVAIPAVLAFNVFSRSNQMLMAQLDGFAHELHHYLVTGQTLPNSVRGI
ncbi:MAG: MotA/TolQ/ExbB proton channel family protein [Candidatus Thiodiazotropha sp. 6PLUC2]